MEKEKVTKEEYLKALEIVESYHSQIFGITKKIEWEEQKKISDLLRDENTPAGRIFRCQKYLRYRPTGGRSRNIKTSKNPTGSICRTDF